MDEKTNKILSLVLTVVVSVAISIGSFFGINVLSSCETLDSVTVKGAVTFVPKQTTEFEEHITNPLDGGAYEETSPAP